MKWDRLRTSVGSSGLTRRTFLRGLAGTVIGLPLLELNHGNAWAAGAGAGEGKRFITIFSHGGTIYNMHNGGGYVGGNGSSSGLDHWSPPQTTEGPLQSLGSIHQPLIDYIDELTIVRGVDNKAGIDQGSYGGGHRHCNVSVLTAAEIGGGDDETAFGPSIDHVLAARLGQRFGGRTTPLHLNIHGHQYGSPFFRASQQREEGESNARDAFASIFAGVTNGEPDPQLIREWEMKRSVLDATVEGFSRFRNRLSSRDQQVIEAHMQHIREIEQRVSSTQEPGAQCIVPGEPADTDSPEVVAPLHVDIILAALRCGLTHVANLEIADIVTPWAPSGLLMGTNLGHSLHHMAREVGPEGSKADQMNDWVTEMTENRHWRLGLMKQLMDGLTDPAFNEGERTMLDNSLIYYTSEFSRGEKHSAYDGLVLLAGSAGGYLKKGHYLNYNSEWRNDPNTRDYSTTAATNNLYITFLNAFGENDTEFGAMEHTYRPGPLEELCA